MWPHHVSTSVSARTACGQPVLGLVERRRAHLHLVAEQLEQPGGDRRVHARRGRSRAPRTRRARGRSRPTPLLVPSPPITSTNTLRAGVIGVGWAGHQHADAYAEATRRRARRDRRARGARAHRAGRAPRRRAPRRRAGRSCSRTTRWTSSASPCRRSCTRRSRSPRWSADCTCCPRSRSRARVAEAETMVAAARRRGRRARRRLQPPPARGHPDAQGGSSTRAGSGGSTTPRRGGCGGPASRTLGSWFTNAEQAGGGPLLDIGVHVLDYALFLLGQPAVTTVSASTYDLLGHGRVRLGPGLGQDRRGTARFDVEDLASGVHAPRRRRRRCWSRRAGRRTARRATSSGSRCSAPRAAPSCASSTWRRSGR